MIVRFHHSFGCLEYLFFSIIRCTVVLCICTDMEFRGFIETLNLQDHISNKTNLRRSRHLQTKHICVNALHTHRPVRQMQDPQVNDPFASSEGQ
jgi:hypothetical protein